MLVLAPVLATCVDVAAHLTLSHLLPREAQRAAILSGFAAGLAALAWLTWTALPPAASTGDCAAYALLNLAAYWGLAFGYFAFVNLNIASLRIRILKELMLSPAKRLDEGALLARYDAAEVRKRRLARLVEGWQLIVRDGRYLSGRPVFLTLARVMDALKWVILGPGGVRRF
jgi:hypothetical protein